MPLLAPLADESSGFGQLFQCHDGWDVRKGCRAKVHWFQSTARVALSSELGSLDFQVERSSRPDIKGDGFALRIQSRTDGKLLTVGQARENIEGVL